MEKIHWNRMNKPYSVGFSPVFFLGSVCFFISQTYSLMCSFRFKARVSYCMYSSLRIFLQSGVGCPTSTTVVPNTYATMNIFRSFWFVLCLLIAAPLVIETTTSFHRHWMHCRHSLADFHPSRFLRSQVLLRRRFELLLYR